MDCAFCHKAIEKDEEYHEVWNGEVVCQRCFTKLLEGSEVKKNGDKM